MTNCFTGNALCIAYLKLRPKARGSLMGWSW